MEPKRAHSAIRNFSISRGTRPQQVAAQVGRMIHQKCGRFGGIDDDILNLVCLPEHTDDRDHIFCVVDNKAAVTQIFSTLCIFAICEADLGVAAIFWNHDVYHRAIRKGVGRGFSFG